MLKFDFSGPRKRRPTYRSNFLVRVLNKWPGKQLFGYYRFMPGFFLFGALLEYTMIHWRVNGVNFYDSFKRHTAEDFVRAEIIRKEIEAEAEKAAKAIKH